MHLKITDTVPGNPTPILIPLLNVETAAFVGSEDPGFPNAFEFHAKFENGSELKLRSMGRLVVEATMDQPAQPPPAR